MLAWDEVPDHSEGKNEDEGRHSSQHHEGDIDPTVQALTRAAMRTFGKVALIVFPHLGREAGNVIAPSGKNIADDSVCAFTHSLESYRL